MIVVGIHSIMTNYQTWIPTSTSTSFPICNCNGFPTSFCNLSFSLFLSCSCHVQTSMSHFFECLPNHNVILIVVWHCEGSVLTNNIISTLINPKNSHSNTTSNILGIACNMLAIPLGPPILIYLFKNCFTHVFAIPHKYYFPISSYPTRTFYGDDVLQGLPSVHVHNMDTFVYELRLVGPLHRFCDWFVSITHIRYPPLQPIRCRFL